MRTASSCFRPKRSACCRKSDDVSTRTVRPACSIITETLRRLSRGSSEQQVSHSQPIEGTPVEVPVPRKVSFMERDGFWFWVFGLWLKEPSERPKTKNRRPFYFPPVISLLENARGLCVALVSDTYCMRKSDNRPSSIWASWFVKLPLVFCCNIPSTSIQCLPNSRSTSRL